MHFFGILGLLAGLLGVPSAAMAPRPERPMFYLCGAAGWIGLIATPMAFHPDLAGLGLLIGPVLLGPWMAGWALAGRARRRRATPPRPSAG